MKIAIGADHAGFEVKDRLAELLRSWGHTVLDAGTDGSDSVDYPDYAEEVAGRVGSGEADYGLLVCGSGIGMSIAANKVAGVRAALCFCETTARLSRQHNDANVLCVGARITGYSVLEELVRVFFETTFEGGRHQRRVDKMNDLD
ncbi:MAG: ribose 5-phosphate isomerase B [Acidobacteria bacterium]|uniref:Ribose 5-phosphate isomerase B n=1 Tax=Candidatus Polarisedimenticola svalbardensis TaxID=2886004 RepID=A0A8J7C2I5_9BACT|nr:ribose 5-phosphate isomerase B [Candidatus Polarisedimenticola svalbardensis]